MGNLVQKRLKLSRAPRVLIGTLYTDENEYPEMLRMLRTQTFTNWEHVVLKDLENKEAHDALYRLFMREKENFDFFLKLDADMVFRSPDSLEELVRLICSIPEADHLMTPVLDWYSGLLIPALHMFSNRSVWVEDPSERLFVDPAPTVPGRRIVWKKYPAPVVVHSPNPSLRQAFLFGVHRASKVVQREQRVFRRGSWFQWRLLESVWKRFEQTGDRRLAACLYGAELVLRGELSHADYVAGKSGRHATFEIPEDHLDDMLKRTWSSALKRRFRYTKLAGPRLLWSFINRPPSLKRAWAPIIKKK